MIIFLKIVSYLHFHRHTTIVLALKKESASSDDQGDFIDASCDM